MCRLLIHEAAERKIEVIRTVNDTVYVNKEVKVREEVPVRSNEQIMLGSILFDINKTMPMQGQEDHFCQYCEIYE